MNPDIEVGARVRAKRLRFERDGEARVEWDAEETESATERRNPPDELEAGVTCRDVDLTWYSAARARVRERRGP